MPKIHKTKSKFRSFRRKTMSRAKRGGMMRVHVNATALTFRAMDAAAAATTNPNVLEAIRLTKQIMNYEFAVVSFHAEGGIYYLDVSVGPTMVPHIRRLVNAMKKIPHVPMGAIARNRNDMVRLSACSYVPPLQKHPHLPLSMSQMERMKLLGGPMNASMMRRLMTPHHPSMDARAATKMTTCISNHHASELTRPPPIVRNALKTIGMMGTEGQPEVDSLMFRVEMDDATKCPFPNGHQMNQHEFAQFYEAYTGMPPRVTYHETVRVALQKLCDTLMPADVVVAIAKKMQNEAMERAMRNDGYEA